MGRPRRRDNILGSLFWVLVLAGLITVAVLFGWHGIEIALGAVALVALLGFAAWWIGLLLYFFLYFVPKQMWTVERWINKGLCPECHTQLYATRQPSGDSYGSTLTYPYCANGHSFGERGSRRFADWAGF
jgi:hypothetical protein